MELAPLSEHAGAALTRRGLSAQALLAVRLVVTCLQHACDSVIQDTGLDRYDDETSKGQLRWRRARNRVVEALDDGLIDGLEGVGADVSDNALQVPVDGTRISFYSARDGVENPDLSGGRKTKRIVVSDMQMELALDDVPATPTRLVVMYEADADGLASALGGFLSSAKTYAWQVLVYKRDEVDADLPSFDAKVPDHAALVEPELPPLEDQPTEAESEEEVDAGDELGS